MYATSHHNSQAARRAHAEMVIGSCLTEAGSRAIGGALAEAWAQGEHQMVRDTIRRAATPQQRAHWLNDARSLLPNELMKEAFDRFMAGR